MAKGKGNGAGRPKMYDREYILALIPKLEAWCKLKRNFWLGDFAIENRLWRQRLDEFANEVPEFSDALKRAKTVQESRLLRLGLKANIKPTMPIFALKNVAGWRDEQPAEQVTQIFNITIGTNGQTKTLGEIVQIGNRNGESAVN